MRNEIELDEAKAEAQLKNEIQWWMKLKLESMRRAEKRLNTLKARHEFWG